MNEEKENLRGLCNIVYETTEPKGYDLILMFRSGSYLKEIRVTYFNVYRIEIDFEKATLCFIYGSNREEQTNELSPITDIYINDGKDSNVK